MFYSIVKHCFPIVSNIEYAYYSSWSKSNNISWLTIDFKPNFYRSFHNEEYLFNHLNSPKELSELMFMPWLEHKKDFVHELSENLIIPIIEVLFFQNRGCHQLWNTKVLFLEKVQKVCE